MYLHPLRHFAHKLLRLCLHLRGVGAPTPFVHGRNRYAIQNEILFHGHFFLHTAQSASNGFTGTRTSSMRRSLDEPVRATDLSSGLPRRRACIPRARYTIFAFAAIVRQLLDDLVTSASTMSGSPSRGEGSGGQKDVGSSRVRKALAVIEATHPRIILLLRTVDAVRPSAACPTRALRRGRAPS